MAPVFTGRVLDNDLVQHWHGREDHLIEHLEQAWAEYARAAAVGDVDIANMIVGEAIGRIHAIEDAHCIVRRMALEAADLVIAGAARFASNLTSPQ